MLGELPRTTSLMSNVSLRSDRPYPLGLGWTPQITPNDPGVFAMFTTEFAQRRE